MTSPSHAISEDARRGSFVYNEKLRCYQCTECGQHYAFINKNYCHNCGVKMSRPKEAEYDKP